MIKILHHLNYYLIISSFFILGFYLLDPYPHSWGTDNNAFMKYFPVFLINISLLFNFYFYIINISVARFILGLFLAIMLFGSLSTVLISGNSFADSFLGRSLISLSLINFITILSSKRYVSNFKFFFLYFFSFYSLWVFVCLIMQQTIGFFDINHIFHEEIFLVTSSSVLFITYFRSLLLKFLFSFIAISSGFLSFKLTGFICSFFAIFIISAIWWNMNGKQKLNRRMFIILNYSLLILSVLSIVYFLHEYLPSGSPSVRLATYAERLLMFLESPFYGTLFNGSPILQHAWLSIPSHSDLLDILAFGGIFSFFLFLYYPMRAIFSVYKNLSFLINQKRYFLIFNFLLIISYLFVFTFNPVMHQPKLSIFFWFSLAYLLLVKIKKKGSIII